MKKAYTDKTHKVFSEIIRIYKFVLRQCWDYCCKMPLITTSPGWIQKDVLLHAIDLSHRRISCLSSLTNKNNAEVYIL